MKKILIIILALFVSNASYAADSSYQQLSKGNPTKSCLQYNDAGSGLQGASTSNINLGDGMVGANNVGSLFLFRYSSSGYGTMTLEHVSNNFDDVAVVGKIEMGSSYPMLARNSTGDPIVVSPGDNLSGAGYGFNASITEALDANQTYFWIDTIKCTITP